VDEPLKHLMQELGNAINDSLSESDRIAEAIGEIKRPDTTSFWSWKPPSVSTAATNPADEDADVEVSDGDEEPKRNFEATGKIKFTSQDHRFLRALKIAVDDESR
jgi:hypothetical protein